MAEAMAQSNPGKESSAIRILIANVPANLEQWLAQVVENEPDIEIVGQSQGYVALLLAAQQDVDVVVLSAEELWPPPGICSHLLAECPDVKVLLLSPRGDKAALYWLGLHRQDVQSVSSNVLLQMLRQLDTFTTAA